MSFMRKPTICICQNKGADELRGYVQLTSAFCFRYRDRTIPLKFLAIFCGCTAQFVSGLVKNPKDRFSHDEAHVKDLRRHDSYSHEMAQISSL